MPLSRFFEGDVAGTALSLYGRPGTSKTSMLLQTIAGLPHIGIDPGEVLWSTGVDPIEHPRRMAERFGLARRLKGLQILGQPAPSVEYLFGYARASRAKILVLDGFHAKQSELIASLTTHLERVRAPGIPMVVVAYGRRMPYVEHRADVHLEVSFFKRSGDARRLLLVEVPKNRFGDIDPILLRVTKRGVRAAT